MILLQDITYIHPNRDVLFRGLDLIINKNNKVALIGNNGTGKSTLLKLMAGELVPFAGMVKTDTRPYYVPQIFGQYNHVTIAQALGIDDKLQAFAQILNGDVSDETMAALNDDWTIEERCQTALAKWGLMDLAPHESMGTLSGGQKTKVFLAGIDLHKPDIVLMDEPSNHLDRQGRQMLYNYIKDTNNTLVVVSHDRALLNLLATVCELAPNGITTYGGNYEFYAEQKAIAHDALNADVKSKEKALRKARDVERETVERQQKLDARGKRKQEKAGMPAIMMNTMRNSAERSTSKIKGIHTGKIEAISQQLSQLRSALPDGDKMKVDLDTSALHKGKTLVKANAVNVIYGDVLLWKEGLSFEIYSGDRITIKGLNGSGKTTLIKMILGQMPSQQGSIDLAAVNAIYIDQDYSLVDNSLTVYQQAQHYNTGALQEHDIKIRLNRFLFTKNDWDKPCHALSGGEKMRLMLCSLTIAQQAPDMIILDEPTNNLDMQNIEILTAAIADYRGTLLVVSHDEWFLQQVWVKQEIVVG
ncbi:MAG: ABC-F family ATP-binding cassette domain-containing protein [Bacteroidota bacterium]